VQLIEALRFSKDEIIAFVGAGGKTAALFRAARELTVKGGFETQEKTVLITTTTHLGAWQTGLADHFIRINADGRLSQLDQNLPTGVVLLAGNEKNNRLTGLTRENIEKLRIIAEEKHLPLLIEADGSGGCPLKAPSLHEPVIPEFVRNVVVVAGLMGLGKPLTKNWVHRPEIFAQLTGMSIGEEINIDAVVKVLQHKDGGLKCIPPTARRVLLLNQADNNALQSQGRVIAEKIIPEYQSTIIASLGKYKESFRPEVGKKAGLQGDIYAVIEQIGGIILAAGSSSRFGEPKQLLLWNGEPFVRHLVYAAIRGGLSPVVVVLGSSADEVRSAISDLPVRIVNNTEWMTGVSSSIRTGITAMPSCVGGAIFLQADQPQTSPLLISRLVEAHQVTMRPITAPLIDGQRGNPVLLDRKTFTMLLTLEGDLGGRTLFSRFPIQWVPWHDAHQTLDIDTPEDYRKFLEIYQDYAGMT
jgi:molybdenum cofactor cytidylyltransferase